jgi:molybdopterin-guanine dinucleotide biosynthesis protein A
MTDRPQSTVPRTGALILAGGQSRRMGRDKAELRLPPPDGPRVIDHVIKALAEVVARQDIIIVGGDREMLGLPTAPDVLAGQGPLVGLYSGLRQTMRDWNFAVACDLPLLQPTLLRGLLSLADDGYDAIVPMLGKGQTTCALYHRRILPTIERLLAEDVRSLRELLAALNTRYVAEGELRGWDGELVSFVNLNTLEDYARVMSRFETRKTRKRTEDAELSCSVRTDYPS